MPLGEDVYHFLQRTSGDVGVLMDRAKTSSLVALYLQVCRHAIFEAGEATKVLTDHCSDCTRGCPCSIYAHLPTQSRALSTFPKEGGWGVSPSFGAFS